MPYIFVVNCEWKWYNQVNKSFREFVRTWEGNLHQFYTKRGQMDLRGFF